MTVVKICGLTRLDDALAAAEAGADLLGFVLVESSPRFVDPGRAGEIIADLRARGISLPCVGVVAGLPAGEGRRLKERWGFNLMQVHGEGEEDLISDLYPEVIVARQVCGLQSLVSLARIPAFAYLLDARGIDRRHGGAVTWDWQLLQEVRIPGRVIVAGGLRPGNVAEAVRAARPYGVDVASGVESEPGRKDRAAMVEFVRTVREVDREEEDRVGGR